MKKSFAFKAKVTIYRDDSTTPVVYEPVKHFWFTCNNTVLVVAYFTDEITGTHDYAHWPRENFTWFKVEKLNE